MYIYYKDSREPKFGHGHLLRLVVRHELLHNTIDLCKIGHEARLTLLLPLPWPLSHRGSILLEAVVQVREIHEGQRWIMLFVDGDGGFGDPSGGLDAGAGSPEPVQRKRAEIFLVLQVLAQSGWLGVHVCHFTCR